MTPHAAMNADNQYTLILGAEGEMGRAMAREIARKGCHLLLVSTTRTDLQRFAIGLQLKEEVQVDAVKLRLEDREAVQHFVEHVRAHYELRALINNITCDWSIRQEQCMGQMAHDDFMNRFRGAALMISSLLPHMTRQSASFIQHIIPFPFRKEQFTPELQHAASKMLAFARGLEEELKHTPVSVSILHPAPIRNLGSRISEEGEPMEQETSVTPSTIAIIGVKGMLRGNRLIIPGFWNKISFFLSRPATSWFRTSDVSLGSSLQPSV